MELTEAIKGLSDACKDILDALQQSERQKQPEQPELNWNIWRKPDEEMPEEDFGTGYSVDVIATDGKDIYSGYYDMDRKNRFLGFKYPKADCDFEEEYFDIIAWCYPKDLLNPVTPVVQEISAARCEEWFSVEYKLPEKDPESLDYSVNVIASDGEQLYVGWFSTSTKNFFGVPIRNIGDLAYHIPVTHWCYFPHDFPRNAPKLQKQED